MAISSGRGSGSGTGSTNTDTSRTRACGSVCSSCWRGSQREWPVGARHPVAAAAAIGEERGSSRERERAILSESIVDHTSEVLILLILLAISTIRAWVTIAIAVSVQTTLA